MRYIPARAIEEQGTVPSEAWLFAQAILGRSIPSPAAAAAEERTKRELLDWLADISPEHDRQRRARLAAEADAAAKRRQLEWLAQISTRHEVEWRRLLAAEAAEREAQSRVERFIESLTTQEAVWDPAKHPRRGTPPNPGWFAHKASGTVIVGTRSRDHTTSRSDQRATLQKAERPTPADAVPTEYAEPTQDDGREDGPVSAGFAS
jgi:hypothetical protein